MKTLAWVIGAVFGAAAMPSVSAASEVSGVLTQIAGVDDTYTLSQGDRELLLETRQEMPPSGSRVRISGRVDGDRFHPAAAPVVLEPAPTAITLGARSTLVIVIDLGDDGVESPELLRKTVFVEPYATAEFFREASFGKTTIEGMRDPTLGDVGGPYRVPVTDTPCNYAAWSNAAREAAIAAGWDVAAYDHVIHWFSQQSACPWGGLGQINGSSTWINGAVTPYVFNHEIGHNLGLMHANGYRCTDQAGAPTAISDACATEEYRDPFDTMGSTSVHFSAFNKAKLGWIPSENVTTVRASGTYTVAPATTASTRTQLLEIEPGRGSKEPPLYVDFRQPAPVWERFLPVDPVTTGASIRIATNLTWYTRTHLIDTVPTTTQYTDAPLAAGRTYTDPLRDVTIQTLSADATGLVVSITFTR